VAAVRVLIFHGWLLRGTGSNVYNASLARALAEFGHEVHLVCQDRRPPDLGPVRIHNPDIGGLLPVFVRDTYEGFEVKTFGELTAAELKRYIELNVRAVRGLVDGLGGFDAALANHLVMAPVILARAGLRFAIKVHGSDLSYTVLPEPGRFVPYVREGVAGANGILVGSGHILERLREAVDEPAINAKVRLGPPGVDTDLFAPIRPEDRAERLHAAARELRAAGGDAPAAGSVWDRDVASAADALTWFAEAPGARAIFVGKLIVAKGIDLLLAAWPLVHRAHPGARLLLVGFGAAEPVLRRVWEALEAGDVAPLRELAERGRALEGGEEGSLPMLAAFLDAVPDGYVEAARAASESVRFAGRLEHEEVAAPVAASDSLVFPSTFPEAFGMVAAEAAAAGVLPISAAHSGAAEVSRALAAELPDQARALLSFELDSDAVDAIATRLEGWFGLDRPERERIGASLRDSVERLWSWRSVADTVLAASAGELAGLRRP